MPRLTGKKKPIRCEVCTKVCPDPAELDWYRGLWQCRECLCADSTKKPELKDFLYKVHDRFNG